MRPPKDDKLTGRQELFCQEYAKNPNGTRAAIAAGYSSKGAKVRACKLLTKDNIRARIKAIHEDIKCLGVYDAEWVLQGLQDLYAIAMQAHNVAGAARCLELLGKHKGLFTDAKDSGTAMPTINVHIPDTKAQAQAGSSPVFKLRKPGAG